MSDTWWDPAWFVPYEPPRLTLDELFGSWLGTGDGRTFEEFLDDVRGAL